ncbi:amino acid adenylation domain-containing protein [candidate division CSSED10-310 bacterium]|uniref:Amino acid adenylation domain-containing protein n=1 Tax=candidate division CSSED10-310 bacterium TaxID=2855610 RepID=A0ABV6YT76_UNCC1
MIRHPTSNERSVISLNDRITDLSDAKRELLILNLRKKGFPVPHPQIIPCQPSQQKNLLSFAQERIWFLHQLEPDSIAYNRPAALRIRGSLQIDILEQSLNEIIKRHHVLRAIFTTVDDQPRQFTLPSLKISLPVHDLCSHPLAERETKVREFAIRESKKPFNLSQGPLIRGAALRISEIEHILFLVMHHIVFDAWSLDVLLREISILYGALAKGRMSPLPTLTIQYADYASWQRQEHLGEEPDKHRAYWENQLKDHPPYLELQTDRARPPVQTNHGKKQTILLSRKFIRPLKTLALNEEVTLYMVLLAAFKTLLFRYTGQHDIIVGSPIAGREHLQTEPLIGVFINILPLRTTISGNPTFRDLLQQVRTMTLEATAHQNLPFEQLVQNLQPVRDLSRTPIFQVLFNYRNIPSRTYSFADLQFEPFEFDSAIAQFDLTLEIMAHPEGLQTAFLYNTDLFNDSTIERLSNHFCSLLSSIISNPDRPLSELPFLSEAEEYQLLTHWNDTGQEYPKEKCLQALFEMQVERTPHKEAIVFEEHKLSYQQLNKRANQLAFYLLKLGVGPGVLVGVHIKRSLDLMIGLLGILKAGGAYVPIDPSYPEERISFMMENSQLSLMISLEQIASTIPQNTTRVICLDSERDKIALEKEDNPAHSVTPQDLAYVIYTSGSTGKPKGVQIHHQALVNVLYSMMDKPGITAQDSLLALTTISFDIAALELFLPLLAGARIVLASQAERIDGDKLLKKLSSSRATMMQATPAHWKLLLAAGWRGEPPLKILCGGEALPLSLAQQLTARSDMVWNMYGPTETTIWSTVARVTPDTDRITIGRPIANTRIYLLDPYLKPVPIGLNGELYIGGDGVSRGYLSQPTQSSACFISNPLNNKKADFLFRTGDMARYLPDGRIEFLGRSDRQVKIRGFRIELAGIETVLNKHPAVKESVVIVRDKNHDDPQLVAYLLPAHRKSFYSNDIQEFLLRKMPSYMVPSHFVELREFPVTPSGKIDRQALATIEGSPLSLAKESISPRTPVEEILANIWRKLFGIPKVSLHDNFFYLGGHSLLATQIITHIRRNFHIEVPLIMLFEHPSLLELSQIVESLLSSSKHFHQLSIAPVSREGELKLSFAQQRLWFLNQLEPDSPVYNFPLVLHLSGVLNISTLEQSLNEVIKRHEILRTSFPTVAGQPVQKIAAWLTVKLNVIDFHEFQGSRKKREIERRITTEIQKPFNLAQNPLVRAMLLKLGSADHILLLIMPHIITDGWSMNVLASELSSFYRGFEEQKPVQLPKLPVQYADFACWQRELLRDERLESLLNYWKKQLSGLLPVLELPLDHPRPPIQTFNGAHQVLILSPKLSNALKLLSYEQGVTLFMTLLAGFKVLLNRYSGQHDVIVGSPIAHRHHADLEGLIGFFVNILVLRTNLSGILTFRELLNEVFQTCLEAYTHQDLTFEKLVEELDPDRDLSQNPLFQILFVVHNTHNVSWELSELKVKPWKYDKNIVRFDLEVHIREVSERLEVEFVFNTDLFNRTTITRLANHYQTLLEGIVVNPDQRLMDLPLLSDRERHQIEIQWNDTDREYPGQKCIHHLFESLVSQKPDCIALENGEEHLTYGELNHRANHLAYLLQQKGVEPEKVVGIFLERSVDLIVALLAVLKAGGVYLPLDPAYPAERLDFILADAAVKVLLTQTPLLSKLPVSHQEVVCCDTDWKPITQPNPANLDVQISHNNLAYIIYTSGSSGKPKGVSLSHQTLVNLITWQLQHSPLSEHTRTLQFASMSFDVSLQEIFVSLCSGGTLVLFPEIIKGDAEQLLEFVRANTIERLFLPPGALQQILERGDPDQIQMPHVRAIITAGEQLQITPGLRTVLGHMKSCSLFNHYGPSESHVVTSYSLPKTPAQWPELPPIGRPISNTQVYIFDKMLNSVPIGVWGELYLGGVNVGRGYFNCPDLTAEKFMPHPLSTDNGDRLYRTGDSGRFQPDGNIKFLGRLDHQVKIRGYRIELGEIEAVLRQNPAVGSAVVTTTPDVSGQNRLVAYVVPSQDKAISILELRRYVKKFLPDNMVPALFVVMESLPHTPTGKYDRRSLPLPDSLSYSLSKSSVPPRTPVEEVIALIWSKLLTNNQISIHDNFFDLGGHSLLATRLISFIGQTFQVDVPLSYLFEYPTIAELSHIIEKKLQVAEHRDFFPSPARERQSQLPLSYAQQRLWFLNRLEPENRAYNLRAGIQVQGRLNISLLEKSLTEIIKRHDILRTTFLEIEGRPVQKIADSMSMRLQVIDLQKYQKIHRALLVDRILGRETQQPFNLSQGPLLRLILFRLEVDESLIILLIHHIIADGWSFDVFFQELISLYQGYIRGKPIILPELPLQYADFALWQREILRGEALELLLDYWKQRLGGTLSTLELQTDRPRPPVQTFKGAQHILTLSPPLVETLRKLSLADGVTLFMTLLAAFKVLLHRYTGQYNIIIGSPSAFRNRAEFEGLIGFFVNTLVVRSDLSGNPTFRDFVSRVFQTCIEAYTYHELPFEKLVEELDPERDLSQNPLFQVIFATQNIPEFSGIYSDLNVKPISLEIKTVRFDLEVYVREMSADLEVLFVYNTDLFEEDTITRLAAHYHLLLAGVVANPAQRLSDLALLTDQEQQAIVLDWNATDSDYPADKCIPQLFEEQAHQRRDSIALVYADQHLTYGELNQRSNQLAHFLRRQGIWSEQIVGICMERSVEMVIGLLAILKSGAVYVPIDPDLPRDRMKFMLEDCQAALLLTRTHLKEQFSVFEGTVICLDTVSAEVAQESCQDLAPGITVENLAYIMYTSGSTGQPKGVEVCHSSVIRLLFGIDYVQLDARHPILQLASLSFDASTFELWASLLHGSQCVLFEERVPTIQKLGQTLRNNNILTLWLTGSLFNVIVDEAPEILTGLHQLLIGGEALSVQHVRRALELLPTTRIINGYGPTEGTTFTCCFQIPNQIEPAVASIPIGHPISNTQVYILDMYQNPTAVGVPGELFISGEGLARGYHQRSDLSADKFRPHPFESNGRQRLYQTGDVVRSQTDGTIQFLGRLDHQVKIRGFRIELGEIEALLEQHAAIKNVVAAVREDSRGEKQLVAYVNPAQPDVDLNRILRPFLQQKLPAYMIPAKIVVLDSFPLTATGKIDRGALPSPEPAPLEHVDTTHAARDELEAQLVTIWKDVLDTQAIGIRDNFFAVGGHSLLAVRVIDQIARFMGQELPLAIFFQAPTIAALAEILRQKEWFPSWKSLIPIQTNGTRSPFFLVPPGGSSCLHFKPLSDALGSDQPFYGLEPLGIDGQTSPQERVEDMAKHYIQEIMKFQPEGPYLLGGICFGAHIAFEMAHQLRALGKRITMLVIFDSHPPTYGQPWMYQDRSLAGKIVFHLKRRKLLKVIRRYLRFRFTHYRLRNFLSPQGRRLNHLLEVHNKAVWRYNAHPCDSRLALFMSGQKADYPEMAQWSELTTAGIEYYVIPNTTHVSLLREKPGLQLLAAELSTLFEKLNTEILEADQGRPT